MEGTQTVLFSETLVNIDQTTLRHISKDRNFNQSRYIFVALLQPNNTSRSVPEAGRTRTDKIGVGAGADIGGTGISCNFMARQYTGPTRQSYRDDHRHVGAMPATSSINRPAFSHFGPFSPHLTPSVCTTGIRSSIIGPGTKIIVFWRSR